MLADKAAFSFKSRTPMWWGMKADFSGALSDEERAEIDERCRQFAELVRASGRGELNGESHAPIPCCAPILWWNPERGRI